MQKKKVYIVTYSPAELNFRAKQLLDLKDVCNLFLINNKPDITLVKKYNIITIRGYKNFLNVFKKIAIPRVSLILNKYLFFPSPAILYVKKVERYLIEQLKYQSANDSVLVTITPPHDLAIIGLRLKKKYPNLRWINDLQDLWTYDEYYLNRLPIHMTKRAIRYEKEIFLHADKQVVTNEYAENLLAKEFLISRKKLQTIYHPVVSPRRKLEVHEIENLIRRLNQHSLIKLAFVGDLFKEPKVPGEFFVRELNRFAVTFKWPIQFTVIGCAIPEKLKREMSDYLKVFVYPRVTHEKAFAIASRSDFLVLLLGDVPNAKVIMHAKYPHYISLNKKILALGPPNSFMEKSINTTKTGYFIDITNDVVKELYNLFVNLSQVKFEDYHQSEIELFSMDHFKNSWLKIIDNK